MNIKLSGIVGKPETRYTPEGKAILTFSLGQKGNSGATRGKNIRLGQRSKPRKSEREA